MGCCKIYFRRCSGIQLVRICETLFVRNEQQTFKGYQTTSITILQQPLLTFKLYFMQYYLPQMDGLQCRGHIPPHFPYKPLSF